MAYHWTRNNHSKTPKSKPRNDFFKAVVGQTNTYQNLNPYDTRSPVKKRNADRRDHARLLKTGYRLLIGTLEQNIYIKGPSQGVWNKTESI